MTYTPRRLLAWQEVHERLRGADMADGIDIVNIGSHAGKKIKDITRKLRDNA